MRIKKAPSEFKKYGANFTMIAREGMIVVYKRVREYEDLTSETYEVHRLIVQDPFKGNEEYDKVESLAGESAWGQRGWSFGTIGAAMAKFYLMVDKQELEASSGEHEEAEIVS